MDIYYECSLQSAYIDLPESKVKHKSINVLKILFNHKCSIYGSDGQEYALC